LLPLKKFGLLRALSKRQRPELLAQPALPLPIGILTLLTLRWARKSCLPAGKKAASNPTASSMIDTMPGTITNTNPTKRLEARLRPSIDPGLHAQIKALALFAVLADWLAPFEQHWKSHGLIK
jgi:hypothetical protein